MPNKRLFIVNAHPGGNKGAEAMLETVVRQLMESRFAQDFEIWIEALNRSSAYREFCQRIGVPENTFLFKPRNLFAPYDIRPRKGDLMIDVGGINYADNSSLANIRNFLRHNFFLRSGVRLIFFTQDFGPAQRLLTKTLARRILGSATCVFSRSRKSYDLLRSAVPNAHIEGPYPDCSLLLPATVPYPSPPLPYIALVPSAIMMNDHGELYMHLMTEIALALPEEIMPVVLAHNFTPNGATSDTEVCLELFTRIKRVRECQLYTEELDPSTLKGILAEAGAVITSRFHAMVGAMSCNVPAFAIGWNHKYEQFMSSYGMAENAFDILENGSEHKNANIFASEIVRRALGNGQEKRERMIFVNDEQKQQVRDSFEKLLSFIES